MRLNAIFSALVVVLGLVAGITVVQGADGSVAYVVSLDKGCVAQDAISLVRDGDSLAVSFGDDLMPGDQISIKTCAATTAMILQYHSGLRERLDAGIESYVVKNHDKRRSIIGNLWNQAAEIFDQLGHANTTLTLTTVRQNNPVLFPWAGQAGAQISPGREVVQVYWVRGVPPYVIRVLDPSGKVIDEQAGVNERSATIDFPRSLSGILVEIGSSSSPNEEAGPGWQSAQITRLSEQKWDELKTRLSDDPEGLPAEMLSLALLKAGGPALTLEAYQHVANLNNGPETVAGLVKAGFELGAIPKYIALSD